MTILTKPVHRETVNELDGTFCCHRGRKLVVSLSLGDVIVFRPKGTRQTAILAIADAYRYALRCAANRALLEKARQRKEAKSIRLAGQRQARAEKRLFRRGQ